MVEMEVVSWAVSYCLFETCNFVVLERKDCFVNVVSLYLAWKVASERMFKKRKYRKKKIRAKEMQSSFELLNICSCLLDIWVIRLESSQAGPSCMISFMIYQEWID